MLCKKKIIIATSIANEYEKAEEHLGTNWKPINKDLVEIDEEKEIAQENIHFQNIITGEKITLRFDISSFFFRSWEEKVAKARNPKEAAELQATGDITKQVVEHLRKFKKDAN